MAIASQDTVTTQTGAKTATTTAPTVLKVGSRGGDVKLLQTWLNQLGYNAGKEDGIFGSGTATALKAFQTASGLKADALYGTQSSEAIQKAILAQKAQNQPDYYAVTGATTPAPTAPVVDKSAQIMQAETSEPPSGQQLGAQAQQAVQQQPDFYAVTGNVAHGGAGGAEFTPPATTFADFRQADQEQMVSTATMTDMKLAEEAQAQKAAQESLGIAGVSPTGTVSSGGSNTTGTVTPAVQEPPVEQGVPIKPPTFVSGGGGMKATTAPTTTVGQTPPSEETTTDESAQTLANASAYQEMSNDLFERLNTMQSEWGPETDPDYQRDAVSLENQVAQMMVARGGLYSSVARAALQASLVSLQSNYRKQAYDRFIQERNFVFQQLQFVSQRIDAEFEKAMSQKNYELAVQKEQFNQQMAIAQFNADQAYRQQQLSISRANAENARRQANYQQQLAEAAMNQQNQYNYYENMRSNATGQTAQYEKYMKEWQNTGTLSTEAATFLGISSADLGSWSSAVQGFANKRREIDNMNTTALDGLRSLGDAEVTLGTYNDFYEQNTAPKSSKKTITYTDEQGRTVTETVEY